MAKKSNKQKREDWIIIQLQLTKKILERTWGAAQHAKLETHGWMKIPPPTPHHKIITMKEIKLKYSLAFTKENAKHYVIYSVLEKRKIPQAYEIAAHILEELKRFPR